jgi:hypothetical protein
MSYLEDAMVGSRWFSESASWLSQLYRSFQSRLRQLNIIQFPNSTVSVPQRHAALNLDSPVQDVPGGLRISLFAGG